MLSTMWVLETELTSLGLEASAFTMLGHLANPQSILESVQKQLSHRAHAYYAEVLGLNHLQC